MLDSKKLQLKLDERGFATGYEIKNAPRVSLIYDARGFIAGIKLSDL